MFTVATVLNALELGFIYALVAMALFLSFRVLNIADMTTDGAFTLGCAVSATAAVAGHPFLGLPLAFGLLLPLDPLKALLAAVILFIVCCAVRYLERKHQRHPEPGAHPGADRERPCLRERPAHPDGRCRIVDRHVLV